MDTSERIPVIICADRIVFFGYVDPDVDLMTARSVKIFRARNCISWRRTIGGIGGLAEVGPNNDCAIGARVPWQVVHGVTVVRGCTSEAVEAWESKESVR